ncbi:HD-GYP domain-containing protein [Alkalibacillus aidingensis]|uniref:HD-GYP domain-containing protein n=1 Tax=Alkalibacillus aidingensis TaxID=2747607 RepID=UPI0016613F31|nr:HD-GYP domain-containing protein [Alkalibacillus aidingensis]
MKVHPNQIVPGCLIIKDVMGQTELPIIPKNTVVEPIHLQVLKKFQVKEVIVANKLVSGEQFEADESEGTGDAESKKSFYEIYVDAVKQTKAMFNNWTKHSVIDLQKVRNTIAPLIEQGENKRDLLLKLYHYNDKHQYFYHHMVSNSVISAYLAKKLGYSEEQRFKVALAAYLSDIGMLKEKDDIYLKDGVLTKEEYETVQKHPVQSYRMIDDLAVSKDVKLAVLQHHERLDGSGYPLGVKRGKIHQYARIIAVSDIFHAMTSERIYRRKESPYKVIEEMTKGQIGKLDMKVVDELVKAIVNFGNGNHVRLTNNEIGTIVFTDEKYPTRPFIRLDQSKDIINLNDHPDLYIEEVL